MEKITLSSSEFKALASETRTGILKMLNERRYTLSEISGKMGMSAPTVKQHLDILQKSQLVEQLDEGRKWKYYALTRKGKKIAGGGEDDGQNVFLIILGLSFIGMVGMILMLQPMFAPALPLAAAPAPSFGVMDAQEMPMAGGGEKMLAVSAETVSAEAGQMQENKTAAGIEETDPKTTSTTSLAIAGMVFFSILGGFALSRLWKGQ